MSTRPLLLALSISMLLAAPTGDRTQTNRVADRTASGNTLDHPNSAGDPSAVLSPPPLQATRPTPPGLGILASGARRIEVIDPLGRRMMRDASTDEGIYEIPDAVIEDVSSEHDNGADADDSLTGYDVDIPTTVDGHYTVIVYSDDGLAMSANGYTSAGIFASDDAVDTTATPVGNVYDVLYSGSGQSVAVTHTATIGVTIVPPHGPTRR